MGRGGRHRRLSPALFLLALSLPASAPAAAPPAPRFVASWGQALAEDVADPALITDTTLRMQLRLSLGGTAIRLRLSNQYGHTALRLGEARIAWPAAPAAQAGAAQPAPGGAIQPATSVQLRFHGAPSLFLAPGASSWSDPIPFAAPGGSVLSVSLFIASADQTTRHTAGFATIYAAPGNQTAAATLDGAITRTDRPFLEAIDVAASGDAGAVVALGDSITDGFGTQVDADQRWPDALAAALAARGMALGVINVGIGGNTVIKPSGYGPTALERLERDVLARSSVRAVVLLEGINDCLGTSNATETASSVISADRTIAARAHAAGLKIYGATLTPIGGTIFGGGSSEQARQIINAFLRHTNIFDGLIDTDAALRDPAHPIQMAAAFDSGDHIHPGPKGMAAIAAGTAAVLAPASAR